MKNNGFIKGALMLLNGILNTLGLGVLVPSVEAYAKKIEAGNKLKLVGYLPLVAGLLLVATHFLGGIKPEDKQMIEDTLEQVKIDTVKVDTAKTIVIDSLKK